MLPGFLKVESVEGRQRQPTNSELDVQLWNKEPPEALAASKPFQERAQNIVFLSQERAGAH